MSVCPNLKQAAAPSPPSPPSPSSPPPSAFAAPSPLSNGPSSPRVTTVFNSGVLSIPPQSGTLFDTDVEPHEKLVPFLGPLRKSTSIYLQLNSSTAQTFSAPAQPATGGARSIPTLGPMASPYSGLHLSFRIRLVVRETTHSQLPSRHRQLFCITVLSVEITFQVLGTDLAPIHGRSALSLPALQVMERLIRRKWQRPQDGSTVIHFSRAETPRTGYHSRRFGRFLPYEMLGRHTAAQQFT